jgi:hypothetical protein
MNNSKASDCIVPIDWSKNRKHPFNITCKNNLSDMYTKLSVYANNPHLNQCTPDGIGYAGKIMSDKNVPPFG